MGYPHHLQLRGGLGVDLRRPPQSLTRVRQALFNLLSNAAKFTELGTIELGVGAFSIDYDGPDNPKLENFIYDPEKSVDFVHADARNDRAEEPDI